MADDVTVRVEGLSRLRRGLRDLGDGVDDLKDANARAARIVATAAAARAPRVSGALAGTLRGNRAAGRASVMAGRASVAYAGPIHWGWPARGIEANPFVVDAAQATEGLWLSGYEADIDDLVDRVKGA